VGSASRYDCTVLIDTAAWSYSVLLEVVGKR